MDAASPVSVRILLVDGNLARSGMASLLLKSKYEVVAADTGKDALHILLKKQHGFNLVLTDINLPDMCCFEFVRGVVKETRLPVGVIGDFFDLPTISKCHLSGATLCLVKPLCSDNIKDLWQYPSFKQREVMLESHQFLMMGFQGNGPELRGAVTREFVLKSNAISPVMHENSGGSQGHSKRKMDELEKCDCWSMGQSSSFIWTSDVKRRFLNVTHDFGLSMAASSLVARCINAPGFTRNLAARKLQLIHVYLRQQCNLLDQMGYPGETSVIAPNPLSITGQPMGPGTNNNHEIIYKDEGESFLTRYLENPYSRAQLKRIIKVSMLKWDAFLEPKASLGTPPSAPLIPHASGVLPISVPVALAQEIENFIHITMAAEYAVPGSLASLYALASQVASIGPPASAELQGGDEELEPGFLEEIDTDDIFDAINELRD